MVLGGIAHCSKLLYKGKDGMMEQDVGNDERGSLKRPLCRAMRAFAAIKGELVLLWIASVI